MSETPSESPVVLVDTDNSPRPEDGDQSVLPQDPDSVWPEDDK